MLSLKLNYPLSGPQTIYLVTILVVNMQYQTDLIFPQLGHQHEISITNQPTDDQFGHVDDQVDRLWAALVIDELVPLLTGNFV